MKQAGYTKRTYSRSPERPRTPQTRQPNASPHTDGRTRGNPQQNVDKYLTLARDATASGDPISAENYYQYADHYYRLVAASRPLRAPLRREPTEIVTPIETLEETTPPIPTPSPTEHWLE